MVSPTAGTRASFIPTAKWPPTRAPRRPPTRRCWSATMPASPSIRSARRPTVPSGFSSTPRRTWTPIAALLDAAQEAGCRAVVVTIDQQAAFLRGYRSTIRICPASSARRARRQTVTNPYRVDDYRLWYEWTFFDKIRPFVKVPIAGQRHSHRRRRAAVCRTRARRSLRLEPRRPRPGLCAVDARGVAGDCRRRARPRAGPLRQRHPPRHRYPQGARLGRECGLRGARAALGTGRLRTGRRAARAGDPAGRTGAGDDRRRTAHARVARPKPVEDATSR